MSPEELITQGPSGKSTDVVPPTPESDKDVGTTKEDNSIVDFDSFTDRTFKPVVDEKSDKPTDKEPPKEESKTKVDDTTGKDKPPENIRKFEDENLSPLPTKEPLKESEKESDMLHLELGISPGAIGHFKNMNKAARDWITSELKTRLGKITELTTQLNEAKNGAQKAAETHPSFYEHPEAIYLLPEYKTVAQQQNSLNTFQDFYRKQLIAIEEGENWTDLAQGADGKLEQRNYKADAAAKAHVLGKLNDINKEIIKVEGRMESLRTDFNSRHIRTKEQVTALENQYFPQYTDPKTIEKNKYYAAFNNGLAKFGLAGDRTAGLLTKLYLWGMDGADQIDARDKRIAELEAQLAAKGGTVNTNGPTGDEINRGAEGKTKDSEDYITFDKFEKAKMPVY